MMRNPHEVDFGSHRAIIKHFCGWEFHRSTFMYTYTVPGSSKELPNEKSWGDSQPSLGG